MEKGSVNGMPQSGMVNKCVKFADRLVTPKSILYLLIIGYIVSLIPLFWIGYYNYPVADDYTFGAACRNVWVESHSVGAVLVRAATRAWEYYQSWAGCMSSSFFMALQPAVFGEGFYRITPFLMIGIISLSTAYLMHIIFVKLLKADAYMVKSIVVLMLFVMIQCMPEPAEGLFWYNGAVHYIFMHGISLFFYGIMVNALIQKDGRKKGRNFILAAILGFIVGMGNYMTALNVGIVFAMIILAIVFAKRFKEQRLIVIPAAVFYISFLINVTAPGNAVREAVSDGMNPVKAIFASFYYVLDYCLGAWSGWVVFIFVAITAVLFWNAAKDVDFDFPCPIIAVVLSYCILAAMITPPLYGTGNIEAGRIKSLIFIMYILLLTVTVCYVTGWARKRLYAKSASAADKATVEAMLSIDSKLVITAGIIFMIFGSALCIIPDPEYYTFSTAAADILNGNAAAYGEAMQERVEIYNASAGLDVEVHPLPIKPKLLCTSDISTDSSDWINAGVCRFYGLNSVRVGE